MSDELPQGWATARISDVTERVPNINPEDSPDKEFGYVDISSIDNSNFVIADVKRFKGKDGPSRARRQIRPNDIVFSNVRTYLRNIAFVDQDCAAEVCSTGFTVLRPNAAVEPRFLFRYVLTDQFLDRVTPQQTGTHYPATSDKVVMSEQIPIAPLAEQRRIVAKLTELLGKVDASRQRLAKIPVLLKRFRQSVLAAACSGRLTADWREEKTTDCTDDTDKKPSVKSAKSVVQSPVRDDAASAEDLPEGWRNAQFSEFIESSFYGPRFGKESYASEGVPTIRTTDMGFDGSIVLTDAPCIKLSPEELEKYRLQHGDLVVTRTGATIGKCAVYDKSRGPAIPGAYLIRFRFKQDLVAPKYVLRFFMSAAGQNLLIGGSNAVAQPNVNATTISQFVIPVPPLPEQQEIVRRVEGLFALADQLEVRLAKARGQVDRLTPSLLARAFAGQLVPQDPTDEPASALLTRICEQRTVKNSDSAFHQTKHK
ncbi:MAG: restriction endonuclease subunit S [Chloroflexi bacterium]|nr:restriction endonuclease subunit S [Chloroflexota bacterium]